MQKKGRIPILPVMDPYFEWHKMLLFEEILDSEAHLLRGSNFRTGVTAIVFFLSPSAKPFGRPGKQIQATYEVVLHCNH